MPCDYSKYPADWKEIRKQILERAGHRCERCGLNNYAIGYRDESGHFRSVAEAQPDFKSASQIAAEKNLTRKNAAARIFVVVLTIAHIHDHDPQNCDPGNLQALCQRCHLRHDGKLHAHNAAITRQRRCAAQLEN